MDTRCKLANKASSHQEFLVAALRVVWGLSQRFCKLLRYAHGSIPFSIGAGENGLTRGRFAGIEAFSLDAALRLVKRNNAKRRFCLFFDSQFSLAVFSPLNSHKAAFLRDDLLKLLVAVGIVGVLCPELNRALEQRLLYFFQQLGEPRFKGFYWYRLFGTGIAAYQHDTVVLHVTRPDFHAYRHAAQLPLIKFPAGSILAKVDLQAHFTLEHLFHALYHAGNYRLFRIFAPDRDYYRLVRSKARRQDQAGFVAVHHDDAANEAGAGAPARGRAILALSIGIQVLDIKTAGEIVSEGVAPAPLPRDVIPPSSVRYVRWAAGRRVFFFLPSA